MYVLPECLLEAQFEMHVIDLPDEFKLDCRLYDSRSVVNGCTGCAAITQRHYHAVCREAAADQFAFAEVSV